VRENINYEPTWKYTLSLKFNLRKIKPAGEEMKKTGNKI
jgi:hypothetical protein